MGDWLGRVQVAGVTGHDSMLVLMTPLEGWASPIGETPDPVFADKMLGDGVTIDPVVGEVRAPCAGVIVGLPQSRHAVTLRATNGAEILIHVGLETVGLGGQGFECRVSDGKAVVAGELLLRFDLELLARRAKSLISPVVVVNGADFEIVETVSGREVRFGETLLTLRPLAAAAKLAGGGPTAERRRVRVMLPHGLHARPAALLAREAGRFAAEAQLVIGDRRANVRSPVSLMGLGVRLGDEVELAASGPDAADALSALATALGDGRHAAFEDAPAPAREPQPVSISAPLATLRGAPAAPGLAIGAAYRFVEPDVLVRLAAGPLAEEEAALSDALQAAASALERRLARESGAGREIAEAHLAFLQDPELARAARARLAFGESAGVAWRGAVDAHVAELRALGDARMTERAADLADLERQVLLQLSGETTTPARLPDNAIVIADDLLPSQLMDLDASRVAGLAISRGGPTSHVAILAAAMGAPAVVALGPRLLAIENGATVILDGDEGRVRVAPTPTEIVAAQTRLAERRTRLAAAKSAAAEPCRTADGRRIEVFANLGAIAEAPVAVANGAEGCGLLRTEFLFMERDKAPDEDEQLAAYQAIAGALGGRPLVIRTLDVGADKPAPYLPLAAEANPALGLRGVRVSLAFPHLLRAQLRAILRVAPAGQARILLPMITSLAELRAVREVVGEVAVELGAPAPPVGAMVETPAAAMMADVLAAEVDFFSIGTNDLAQYALAMDRTEPKLAAEVDALHPAVLRLIDKTVRGAETRARPVAVCGAAASDLVAAPILVGLGVTELSAAPGVLPELKATIRAVSLAACRALAESALAQSTAAEVRSLALLTQNAKGMGRLS